MSWLLLASLAYFMFAIESVVNKFLISEKIKSWQLYIFYIGILSLFAFLLAPLGLSWLGWEVFFYSVLNGVAVFIFLSIAFSALERSPASRVFILMGAVSTLGTLILSKLVLEVDFEMRDVVGIFSLLFGGFLVSYRFHKKEVFRGYKKSIIAGIFAAISYVILKHAFNLAGDGFVSVYIYSRVGIVFMALFLLIFPFYSRKVIPALKKKDKRSKRKHAKNFGGVLAVKFLAGIAAVLLNYSISLGDVAIVNALIAIQYLFVFILTLVLSYKFKILKEDLRGQNVVAKFFGVAFVIIGVTLVVR